MSAASSAGQASRPGPDEQALREAIVETLRATSRLGLVRGTSGNASVRLPDGLLVSPTGIPYDRMRAEQVVRMRWDGSFDGDVLPSSEWRFHRDILFHRPELHAIVHTHSMHATALSIMRRGIPAVHYRIAAAGGSDIRCADYATFGDQALSDQALRALEGRKACLLAHHGVIAAETSLERALSLAGTVEELAQQYLLCLPMGEPPVLDEAEIQRVLVKFRSYGQQPRGH